MTPVRIVHIRSSCQRVSSRETQAPRGRGPARVCRRTVVPRAVLGEGALSTSGPGQWTDCAAGRGGLMAPSPRAGPSSQPDAASPPRSFLGAPSPTGPFWWPSRRGRKWPLLASILSCGALDSRGSIAPPRPGKRVPRSAQLTQERHWGGHWDFKVRFPCGPGGLRITSLKAQRGDS